MLTRLQRNLGLKDAPLEDEEIEVAEDDASLVKQIGQSFCEPERENEKEVDKKAVVTSLLSET
ncbi:hypothetical protein HN873_063554, partial [Arachis hypogaea]